MKTSKNGWGREVRLWRLGAGLTQKDLAEALKIKQATLSRWEASAEPPELQPAIGRLADIMQLPIEEVLRLGYRAAWREHDNESVEQNETASVRDEPFRGEEPSVGTGMRMLNDSSEHGHERVSEDLSYLVAIDDYPELKRILGDDWYYVSATAREMIYEFLLAEIARNRKLDADYKALRAYDGTPQDKERVRNEAGERNRTPRGFR